MSFIGLRREAKNRARNKEDEWKMKKGVVKFEKERKDKAEEKSEKRGIRGEQRKRERQEKKSIDKISTGFTYS